MKTVDDLEPKGKDMEYRLVSMEAIKEPMVTAVATLKKAVDALGMGAPSWRADKVTKSPDWASKVWC